MAIRCFYLPQGLIIGDVTNSVTEENRIVVKNPALIVARQTEVILAPLLHLVEETEIKLKLSDLAFETTFTPKRELINHYNQIYGSGLVLTTSMPGT